MKDKASRMLRVDIVSRKLIPGQVIREDELADRFGVSRTPVMEMLRRLEQEYLVNVIPIKSPLSGVSR